MIDDVMRPRYARLTRGAARATLRLASDGETRSMADDREVGAASDPDAWRG